MTTPLVSIIIPTYNSAAAILRCLKSLSTQTFNDFEVLVMDGLSTDNTIKLVGDFADSRIKVYSEKDGGIYDAMNKGIAKAKGEWLYFLGSDDYLLGPTVLEQLVPYFQNPKIDFLYGNVNSPDYGACYDGIFDLGKLKIRNICHQAVFYRRSVFEKVGHYNISYRVLADWDLNLRCFIHPHLRTAYVDLMVAYFAPAGFGVQVVDDKFSGERNWVVDKYHRQYRPFGYWRSRVQFKLSRMFGIFI